MNSSFFSEIFLKLFFSIVTAAFALESLFGGDFRLDDIVAAELRWDARGVSVVDAGCYADFLLNFAFLLLLRFRFSPPAAALPFSLFSRPQPQALHSATTAGCCCCCCVSSRVALLPTQRCPSAHLGCDFFSLPTRKHTHEYAHTQCPHSRKHVHPPQKQQTPAS
uniref:Uncharacterized protein n=1 Tax=Anopheles darlingi TaxID=43151 RepID=A0A2M4DFP6_ANODA